MVLARISLRIIFRVGAEQERPPKGARSDIAIERLVLLYLPPISPVPRLAPVGQLSSGASTN
jgi:hypothetical protein